MMLVSNFTMHGRDHIPVLHMDWRYWRLEASV